METLRLAAAALGEPRRCRLLQLLMDGPRIVGDLVDETGWKQPLVSHHLATLVRAGLAVCRVDGRKHWYQVAGDATGPVGDLLRLFAAAADPEGAPQGRGDPETPAESPGPSPITVKETQEEPEGPIQEPDEAPPVVRKSDLEDFLL